MGPGVLRPGASRQRQAPAMPGQGARYMILFLEDVAPIGMLRPARVVRTWEDGSPPRPAFTISWGVVVVDRAADIVLVLISVLNVLLYHNSRFKEEVFTLSAVLRDRSSTRLGELCKNQACALICAVLVTSL